MHDFTVPGMLHGRVVRPPAIGAKLESVDDASIRSIAGIAKIVREGNFPASSEFIEPASCAVMAMIVLAIPEAK
jgi:hypothetical protein